MHCAVHRWAMAFEDSWIKKYADHTYIGMFSLNVIFLHFAFILFIFFVFVIVRLHVSNEKTRSTDNK